MDAPVAEGAVGKVEKLTEAAGVNGGVEGALGGGAEPEVPIHAGRWRGVADLLPRPAGGVSESSH